MASHFLPCKEPSPDGSPPTPERDLVTLAQRECLHPAQGQRRPEVWSTDSVQAESEICLNMCLIPLVMRQADASARLQV